jgi:hypothetical protein
MKLTLLSESQKTRVAHVGASKNPDNPEHEIWYENDRHHIDMVYAWLADNGYSMEYFRPQIRTDDFIDLNDGRDFLQERHEYEMVILHHVYSPHKLKHPRNPLGQSPFRYSRYHSKEEWVSRLIGTGAAFIFAFGNYDEVCGDYLGELPGYIGPYYDGSYLSAYIKDYDATEYLA